MTSLLHHPLIASSVMFSFFLKLVLFVCEIISVLELSSQVAAQAFFYATEAIWK